MEGREEKGRAKGVDKGWEGDERHDSYRPAFTLAGTGTG